MKLPHSLEINPITTGGGTKCPRQIKNTIPPRRLLAIIADETGRPKLNADGGLMFLQDESDPNQFFDFDYLDGGRVYGAARMTSYLQRLIDGEEENNGLIIRAFDYGRSVSRLMFEDNNGQVAPLKLKVYYTVVPE